MLITAPCVVSLTWTLADAQGQTLDELVDPVEFLYGGDDLLPALERALVGHAAGYETQLHLQPEQAFGEYAPALVCFEERALFPAHVEAGMQFDGLPEGAQTVGMPQDAIYRVTEVYASHVVLDGNHPLAGIALQLHVKVIAVRAASAAEAEARSVADPGVSVLGAAPGSPHLH